MIDDDFSQKTFVLIDATPVVIKGRDLKKPKELTVLILWRETSSFLHVLRLMEGLDRKQKNKDFIDGFVSLKESIP